ncbi:OLC1v1014802C1 [Oldenlandia corymbosa var. corymbosa]|uniref:OLC1v1014802C1 n=1 Tax=Oldenlandia corymbosa var. corymbosa TaxID=529605 RepID=A0AAV1E228_OLDCO|nr:OLC1v1014802C1 [Oldenlandia corymbosa var. corymbosa]
MASILAKLPTPPIVTINGKQPFLSHTLQNVTMSGFSERHGRFSLSVKASQNTSESSTSLSFGQSTQSFWDSPEDKIALIGLGFAAVVGIWAATNLVAAIDKLPVIPSAFELVGILYSAWFVYRYLLFRPDREELFRFIKKSIANILGQ